MIGDLDRSGFGRQEMGAQRLPSPGDGMLSPFVLIAIALFLINDHVLKGSWPAPLTGKLSGIAGLIFFPLLLQALIEVGAAALGSYRRPSTVALSVCIALTGLIYATGEISGQADHILEVTWGSMRSLLDHAAGGLIGPLTLTQDLTDLLILPALWVPWTVGRSRSEARRASREPIASHSVRV